MSKEFHTYVPDEVSFAFKGKRGYGFAKGTFIKAERDENGFTKKAGSFGDITRTQSLDRSGTVEITIMAESSFNDVLQAIADSDEKFKDGVGSILIEDHRGNMEVHCLNAWIRKRPTVERADEAGNVVWIFDCADIEINAGGNLLIL